MNDWQKSLTIWKNKPFVKALKKQLPKAEIFLVGGAVRDAVLGRETKDFDFVVRGVNKKELEKFLAKQGKVDLVGRRFGVFKFIPKGWMGSAIDIALPRTEHSISLAGIYKDFKIKTDSRLKIEEDLSRRDFTINAMAWDIFNNKLIDPYNGYSDCKKKMIRAVGVAPLRFKEDYSRMLRAIRFACQLDFELAQTVTQGIKTWMKRINTTQNNQRVVPYEVIAHEMNKALLANPVRAVELMDSTGAIEALMPELLRMKKCPQPKNFHSEGDVWQHTILALKQLESKEFKKQFPKTKIPAEVIWAILFHDLGKPYTITKTDRWRFNNHDNISAEKFKTIAQRIKLAAAGVNLDDIETSIRKHMLLAHAEVKEIKATTLEKYFYNDNFPGQQFLMVLFTDSLATIFADGSRPLKDFRLLINRINQLKKGGTKKEKKLVKPLIDGSDIIKTLKLKPGPKIGQLLNLAREAQLKGEIKTKAQALALIKKQ